jgi:type 1 fimbriae regulatory protein FimB/type 1 fimbriae regulatory protein FimE
MGAVVQLRQLSKCVKRPLNHEVRTREYLLPDEIERMVAALRQAKGRMVKRDVLLILLGSNHGLRVSELASLLWSDVQLDAGLIHIKRLKRGTPSTHPLAGVETRELRAWRREQPKDTPYVFTSLRGGQMSRFTINRVIADAGRAAGLGFPCHVHMLRHAAGYYWANQGKNARDIQLWLGHKNIQRIVRYCELAPNRLADFRRD